MKSIWRKLLIQWKLLILFTIMVVIPTAAILLVVQDIIVSQLNARQQEKITFAKNSVTSVLVRSQRMTVNHLKLISRDDAIKDSFYYAVRAKEVGNLKSEIQVLSLLVDYDFIIARDSSGSSLIELGDVPGIEGEPRESLKCDSEPLVQGKVCDEIWKWSGTLLLGALAPVYKSRLVVENKQTFSERDFLGTLIIGSALNDNFAKKVREMTGVEVVIRSDETIYATSRPELRKTVIRFSSVRGAESEGFTTQKIAGISYLMASLPLTTKNGAALGDLIILADNDAIVKTTQRIYFTFYMVSLTILILGMALAFAFAREIGLSIHSLREGAEKIGRGDFTGNIQVKSHVELEILARSFNTMSRNLNSLMTEKENYLEEIRLQHEKIVEQKEYMTSLFENADDLIYVAGLEGRITFINQKIEDYGFGKEEILGKSMHDFITFRGREIGANRNKNSKSMVYEVELNPRKGKKRWMIFSSSQIRDTKGTITSELCILRDITDQKTLEDSLTHFDGLACAGRLAAGVAHEIGNPLTSMSSFLQMLEKKEYDPFTEDCIRTIQKHIERIRFTVERLKNLSRPHSLEKWKNTDIGLIIQSSIDIVQFDPRLRGIEIIREQDEDIPPVTAQGDQLIQVIINLILNGADAMRNSGKITVKTGIDRETNEVVIEIIDTGTGIPEEHLDLIFDPFFTTKGREKGTGLGLYVSQSIIQHHGGRIFLKHFQKKGTNFCIHLPIAWQPSAVVQGTEVD
jgi:PAS domain S-box-containing protein